MITLDHLAVLGETREAAAAHVESALSVEMQPGGAHDVFHTHNRLLGLAEGLYLEAIAVDPEAPAPARPRWFDLDRFSSAPRLGNWICRCDDLDAALAALPEGYGAPVALQRGDLRWRMAVPRDGVLPFDNCAPALMEWQGEAHPSARLAASGCRLERLWVSHPRAEELEAVLAPVLRDGRVSFRIGEAGLSASFDTAQGAKVLR